MTILGFLTTYWRLCVNILGPYFVWYMTIPELGMIGYHPGTVGGLSNLHVFCDSSTEDDCDHPVIAVGYHTLYGMTIL